MIIINKGHAVITLQGPRATNNMKAPVSNDSHKYPIKRCFILDIKYFICLCIFLLVQCPGNLISIFVKRFMPSICTLYRQQVEDQRCNTCNLIKIYDIKNSSKTFFFLSTILVLHLKIDYADLCLMLLNKSMPLKIILIKKSDSTKKIK